MGAVLGLTAISERAEYEVPLKALREQGIGRPRGARQGRDGAGPIPLIFIYAPCSWERYKYGLLFLDSSRSTNRGLNFEIPH